MPNDVSRPKKRMAVVKIKVSDRKGKRERQKKKRNEFERAKNTIILILK